MMGLILYDYHAAPSPRRARILLAEKGVAYDKITIDLAAGEHLQAPYRAINPACTVPALRLDDGTVITENAGIAAYLEAAYPLPAMLGATPAEKGTVASWNARAEIEGLGAVAEALRNTAPAMRDRAVTGPANFAQIPEIAARGLARIRLFFDMLNDRLAGRTYIATDSFSVADITALVTVDFARVVRCKPEPGHAHLLSWRAALAERPSVAA